MVYFHSSRNNSGAAVNSWPFWTYTYIMRAGKAVHLQRHVEVSRCPFTNLFVYYMVHFFQASPTQSKGASHCTTIALLLTVMLHADTKH